MADPVYDLRQGEAGEFITGTPGHVLTFVGNGRRVQGLPAAAPTAFYQTVEDDGAPLPQENVLNLVNATLADNPGVSTDLTLHYQVVQNSDGGDLPPRRALHFGPDFLETDDAIGDATRVVISTLFAKPAPVAGVDDGGATLAGSGGSAGLLTYLKGAVVSQVLKWTGTAWVNALLSASEVVNNAGVTTPGATVAAAILALAAPFRATSFVDPLFAGTQLGTQSNPYVSANAAFAAQVAAGYTAGLVLLAPGANLVENVAFPTTGNDWELACLHGAVGTVDAQITGTVTANPAGTTRYRLTELAVSGLVGGANAGASQFVFTRVRNIGGSTFTGAGWSISYTGRGPANLNGFNGVSVAAVSVAGVVFAQNWLFSAAVAWNGNPSLFDFCRFNSGSLTGAAGIAATFTDCEFAAALTLTDSIFTFDSKSYASAWGVGIALAGAATLKTLNSNAPFGGNVAGNVGSTNLGARAASGLYSMPNDMTLIASGLATGTATLNAIYTDMTGALVTVPIATLLVTAAAGTKSTPVPPSTFQHNGAVAPIAFSVTGIVAGAGLSISLAVCARREN